MLIILKRIPMGGGGRRTVSPPHCPPIATCCLHVAKNINARTGLIKKIRMSIEITLQIVIGGVPFSMNPHVRLLVVCQSVILRIPPLGALFFIDFPDLHFRTGKPSSSPFGIPSYMRLIYSVTHLISWVCTDFCVFSCFISMSVKLLLEVNLPSSCKSASRSAG